MGFGHQELPEQVIIQRLFMGDEGFKFWGITILGFILNPSRGVILIQIIAPIDIFLKFFFYGDFLGFGGIIGCGIRLFG